jgi:hypothetical protein
MAINRIFARSPFIIEVNELGQSGSKIELFFYRFGSFTLSGNKKDWEFFFQFFNSVYTPLLALIVGIYVAFTFYEQIDVNEQKKYETIYSDRIKLIERKTFYLQDFKDRQKGSHDYFYDYQEIFSLSNLHLFKNMKKMEDYLINDLEYLVSQINIRNFQNDQIFFLLFEYLKYFELVKSLRKESIEYMLKVKNYPEQFTKIKDTFGVNLTELFDLDNGFVFKMKVIKNTLLEWKTEIDFPKG